MSFSNVNSKQPTHSQGNSQHQTQNPTVKQNLQAIGGKNIEEEMLKTAVIDLYVNLKQKIKQYTADPTDSFTNDNVVSLNQNQTINIDEGSGTGASKILQGKTSSLALDEGGIEVSEEERQRLSQLGNLVVIDYIRSSMDILLNLKVERAMAHETKLKQDERFLNSSRGGHDSNKQRKQNKQQDYNSESFRSSARSDISGVSNNEGPPAEYEQIIIGLEGEVRKHIRIEQQLKLHIESIEGRIDELETENGKLTQQLEAVFMDKDILEKQLITTTEQLEAKVQKIQQDLGDQESKHALETRSLQERFQLEREQLLAQITTINAKFESFVNHQSPTQAGADYTQAVQDSDPANYNKNNSETWDAKNGQKKVERNSITNTTNNINITYQSQNIPLSSSSNKTTNYCSQCRSLISPNRAHPFTQYLNEHISQLSQTQVATQGLSNSETKKQPRKGLRGLGVTSNGTENQDESLDNLDKRYQSFSGVALNACGLDGQVVESSTSFPIFQGQTRNLGSAITNHSNITDHIHNTTTTSGSQVQIQNKKIFFKRGANAYQNGIMSQQALLCQCSCQTCISAHPLQVRESEGQISGGSITLHSTSSATSKLASKQQIVSSQLQSQQIQFIQNSQAQQQLSMQQKIQEILNASGPQLINKERRSIENSFHKSSSNGSRNHSNNKTKANTGSHLTNNLIFTQDQGGILKLQQEMNKMIVAERRQQLSSSNKQRATAKATSFGAQKLASTSTFPVANNIINQGTPDKTRNLNMTKGLMTSLTGLVSSNLQPQQSAKSSHNRKAKSSGKNNSSSMTFKKSSINQSSQPVQQNWSGSNFIVQDPQCEQDNPYLHNLPGVGSGVAISSVNKKLMNQSSAAKKYMTEQIQDNFKLHNQGSNWSNYNQQSVGDHSSNSSLMYVKTLRQNDNSMVVLQQIQQREKLNQMQRNFDQEERDLNATDLNFQDSHYNQKALQSLFQSMPNAVRDHNQQNLIIDDLQVETMGLQNEEMEGESLIEQIQKMQRQTQFQNQNLSESMQNSHRRSRSQNVGGAQSAQRQKSKSERRRDTVPAHSSTNPNKLQSTNSGQIAGRILISKNRITTGGRAQEQKSNNFGERMVQVSNQDSEGKGFVRRDQSVKNSSSANRETTPSRNRKIVGGSQSQMGQTIMNSEDRKKLFKTFMKEMNQSLTHTNVQSSANKRNTRANNQNFGVSQNLNDSFQGLRGISNSSSRPRSQLAQQPSHSSNTNYSSIVNQISAPQPNPQKMSSLNVQGTSNTQQNLKFKLVSSGQGDASYNTSMGQASQVNQTQNQNLIGNYQSRNHTQISKIKDYYQNNTYNPHIIASSSGNSQAQINQLSSSFNSKINTQQANLTQVLNQSFSNMAGGISAQVNNAALNMSTGSAQNPSSNFLNQTANPTQNRQISKNKQ